ncbi:TPA: ATP-binding protein [Vibrio diabolicus]
MSTPSFEKRHVNASRLIFGLANIGYKPYAAIEDIIDNSVSAGAREINVIINVKEGFTLTEKENIESVIITDDGVGMNNDAIRTALDIGSDVSYSSNSLSKYGFGLKSAGLSLGKKIRVLSKKDKGEITSELCLDVNEIEKNKEYGVLIGDAGNDTLFFLEGKTSGTVVHISDVHVSSTANNLKNKLLSRLGVIYYEFISNKTNPLVVNIIVKDKVFPAEGIDILYREDCLPSYKEHEYDCKTPCIAIKDKELTLNNSNSDTSPIIINGTIFPQAQMGGYAGFSEDEREKIKSYSISSSNSGFFIFRNGRLIRWGDNLGLITRDLRTFRVRIDIKTEHDELLNVDVSKQNLVLPDEFLDELALLCRIPKSDAEKAFKQCSQMFETNGEREGEQSSESVIEIAEEDPSTHVEPTDQNVKAARRKHIISGNPSGADSSQIAEEESSDKVTKIKYLDYLQNSNLWQSALDPEYGTIVYINKSHQFYQLVLRNLKAADPKRQAIECFIYCVAVGQNMTKENLSSVEYDDIKRTLDRFDVVTSWNLQNWTAHNQDLFD